jgi:hypothetical protein
MRTITDHIVEGDSANHQLSITVLDEPGSGGANHRYLIGGFDAATNASSEAKMHGLKTATAGTVILFQNGPIKEFGVNGLTQEAMAAIIIDRLRSFQAGPFSGDYNERALTCFEEGLAWLQKRTKDRIARGIEGTHTK